MSDYDGTPLAIGSVRGRRQWKIDVDGILAGLSYHDQWTAGENRAKCNGSPKREVVEPKREDESSWDRYYEESRVWRSNHDMDSCSHGFYAYFADNSEWQYGDDPRISGVIEGYGETLIGTKGFRCMKARVLALSIEPQAGIWNLDEYVQRKLRANYPSIPVFESSMAMFAEFPASRLDDVMALNELELA